MANRYWVGGTASWDGTAGTKWALTSGGAGGQAIPTSADDVFLDASSGASTVSIATGNTGAKSITCTGFTGTLAGSVAITVSGSVTLASTMTFSYSAGMVINGTGTFTSAGKSFSGGNINVNGTGITVTLGDAFVTNINLVLTAGTLNTAGFNVTAGGVVFNGSSTRTLATGTSLFTLTGATFVNVSSTTGLTVTGTPTFKGTSSSTKTLTSSGLVFSGATIDQAGSGALVIQGSNTFNDITNTYSATGATTITFTSGTTQTLTQFTATGAVGKVLTLGASTTSAATLSAASGTISVDYMSISYSTATGGASWYAGANSTNGGNNTGWVFTAPPAGGTNSQFFMFF
jgi:hypothetical protein